MDLQSRRIPLAQRFLYQCLAVAGTAALVLSGAVVPAVAAPQSFSESFSGDPGSPRPWDGSNWDVAVHSRDKSSWKTLPAIDADHGGACEAPSATHRNTSYEGSVYNCKNHVMTAINGSAGYGAIYLTPNRMVDFSDGEAVVRFDASTFQASDRDWWDVWLTPYEDNLQAPLESWFPDLAGPPRHAVQITLSEKGTFIPRVYRDHRERKLDSQWWTSYDDVLEPSRTRRDTFELRISKNRVRFGMPEYDYWPVDTAVDLDWDQAVLQLGHHSYTPTKDGAGRPGTWHWDNVSIDPAVPFTIVKSDRRFVDSASQTVTLDGPAPADAHLRFSAYGENYQVSYDGGASWQTARKPSQSKQDMFSNYWTPIPEGTTAVRVRGTGGWLGDWIAKDFSVWSRSTATSSPGTPEPDPTTEPTPEPAPTEPTPTEPAPEEPNSPTDESPPTPESGTFQYGEEFSAGGLTTSVGVPAQVSAGRTVELAAAVTASRDATALIDLEVYDEQGRRVHQQWWDEQVLSAGDRIELRSDWDVPSEAVGQRYTIKVGVFTSGWGSLRHWNDEALTFTVAAD